MGSQNCFFNRVVHLRVKVFTIHLSRVAYLIVFKLESVFVNNIFLSFFEELEQCFIIINVRAWLELTESDEVFSVHTVHSSCVGGESSNVETGDTGLNTAALARLILVKRV